MSALSIEECELLGDSKYRSYISQVEKALRNFESTSEWADLISALGKLNKVLLAHMKYPVIPKRVTIGKRLAQCLHPALPSGVHLKALESYDIIFRCIGTKRLSADLFIYSAGLFPLLGHAAMNVKPVLLLLYERHFISLGKFIKPGLNGLLLGLLPGLEEGSEFYDKTNFMLEEFCQGAGATFFYTSLWDCVLSCPSVRLSAVTFLLSHFNKRQTMEDQLYMMGLNIDLMVSAVCSAMQDESVLVQRSLLDFLLCAFPMHNAQLTKADVYKIVRGSLSVLLRRDMSLNRRLYAWLLGTSSNTAMTSSDVSCRTRMDSTSTSSEMDVSYFQAHSKDFLIQALKAKLMDSGEFKEHGLKAGLKPFRILISLLDKPEIGPVILDNILLWVFRCLYRECGSINKTSSDKQTVNGVNELKVKAEKLRAERTNSELLKTANVLFSTFEPYFLWEFAAHMFDMACQHCRSTPCSPEGLADIPTIQELCDLVEFLLNIVTLETYMETQTEHLPELLRHVISSLTNHFDSILDAEIMCSVKLCIKILSCVLPSMSVIEDGIDDDAFMHPDSAPSINQIISNNTSTAREKDPSYLAENGIEDDALNNADNFSQKKTTGVKRRSLSDTENDAQEKCRKPRLPRQLTGSPLTLMQACVQCYHTLLNTFIVRRILSSKELPKRCLEAIAREQSDTYSRENSQQMKADDKIANSDNEVDGDTISIVTEQLTDDTISAFISACKLLVDFSSFPIYCTEYEKIVDQTCSEDDHLLPSWLQALVACCCHVDTFPVQCTSISTMLTLIVLTQSVQSDSPSFISHRTQSTGEGTISVVMLPALLPRHLQYLERNTRFHWTVATNLWNYLGESTREQHHRSVELFHQLHQVTPNSWICEDVIGRCLISEDTSERIEAYQKFTVLWHLTRDKQMDINPGRPLRTFDRSMFVLLDSLRDETSPTRMLASTWLTHIVQRRDINRVLEPILLMLLHPDTSRISIQHLNIHQPRRVKLSDDDDQGDDAEAKIYAISNEGGNVIYHISSHGKPISGKKVECLKSYALTVLNDKGSSVKTTPTESQPEMDFDRVNPEDLKLRINPFGSQSSLDKLIFDGFEIPTATNYPDLGNVTRLDQDICNKEGIYFDDMEREPTDSTDEMEATSQQVVQEIIDEVFEMATQEREIDLKVDFQKHTERTFSLSSKDSSHLCDDDLLNAIDKRGMDIDSPSGSEIDLSRDADETTGIHTLHMHILLYTQKYDYQRTLYALSTIKSMLVTCPRLFVSALATTSISAIKTPHLSTLQSLLARHRKSVFGKNFFGEIAAESVSSHRSNMYVEVIVSLCLYLIRSYYPNLMMSKLSQEELHGNREVHILSLDILTLLLSELIAIMKDSGKSFSLYIKDLLSRCKLQKAVLHCVLGSVYNSRKKRESDQSTSITEAIIAFNEESLDPSDNETFQIRLLNLLLVLIMLEEHLHKSHGDGEAGPTLANSGHDWDRAKVNFKSSLLHVQYNSAHNVVHQGMFLSAVLSALKQSHRCHMHRHWVAMVTSALPYMGKALSGIVMSVVSQLCRNLEALSSEYHVTDKDRPATLTKIPPDHVLTILEGLTTICHYCLLDNASPVSIGQPAPTSSNVSIETASAGQILTNLMHVFNPSNSREQSPQRDQSAVNPVMDARRGLLNTLPRIISCMVTLWKAVKLSESDGPDLMDKPTWTMGTPKIVKQFILEFLSPISVPHGTHLLGAVAVAWNDRRQKVTGYNKRVVHKPCDDQLLLVDLVSTIKVLPTDTMVQTVRQVLKQPPPNDLGKGKKGVSLEVNMLQFFYAYVQQTVTGQLVDSWSSLLTLLKDALQLNLTPPGTFLLLEVLNEFVKKTPVMEEKKNQKELQDIVQKLITAVSIIGGSCLEQTTWLRRNLAVRAVPQHNLGETEDGEITEESDADMKFTERKVVEPQLNSNTDSKFAVHALLLLAELTAPLLDVVYGSDEKDKVSPFLTTVMYNVFPYLRNHNCQNIPSFRTCSQFLSSISGYQYTRKAWKKEAFELMMDPAFFQMDTMCVGNWRTIIDNLMTHDKTTFKDLMARVIVTQSGSLFSNKEQELEQKAQMLKRLAFAIFCSEDDQYQRSMPDIQERLAESLRSPQVPSVMAQVFLCFRILILRMSPQHLTSLWPTMITELVQVFLQIEQELSHDTEEFRTQLQKIAALDSSWAHLGNGLNAHNNPTWLQLYLSACKLLDLALVLPADTVPQFQLYRWAFISGSEDDGVKMKNSSSLFIPHVQRITQLVNKRLQGKTPVLKQLPGRPLLHMSHLRSLSELQPFFNTLCLSNQSINRHSLAPDIGSKVPKSISAPEINQIATGSASFDWSSSRNKKTDRQFIEEIVERDFLEFMA